MPLTATGPSAGTYTLRAQKKAPAARMAGVGADPVVQFESERMSQLARDVGAGHTGVIDRFWAEAEAMRGPLVEPVRGNDRDVLVTFAWKDETHHVLLLWAAGSSDFMSRLPGTGVWFKTVRVPRTSRLTLEPHSSRIKAEVSGTSKQLDL